MINQLDRQSNKYDICTEFVDNLSYSTLQKPRVRARLFNYTTSLEKVTQLNLVKRTGLFLIKLIKSKAFCRLSN